MPSLRKTRMTILSILLLVVCFPALAQESSIEPFLELWPELEVVTTDYNNPVFLIPPSMIVNRAPEDPLQESNEVNILTFRIQTGGPLLELRIGYGPLPPFNAYGIFIESGRNNQQPIVSSPRAIIVSPGGNVYVLVPLGQNGFVSTTVTEKWVPDAANGLRIVNQPFYHIGESARANTQLQLFSEPDPSSERVALVAEGSEIEIVGVQEVGFNREGDWYLVRSVTGLLGWHQAEYLDTNMMMDRFSISILDGVYP